jgi:hypothetical protein
MKVPVLNDVHSQHIGESPLFCDLSLLDSLYSTWYYSGKNCLGKELEPWPYITAFVLNVLPQFKKKILANCLGGATEPIGLLSFNQDWIRRGQLFVVFFTASADFAVPSRHCHAESGDWLRNPWLFQPTETSINLTCQFSKYWFFRHRPENRHFDYVLAGDSELASTGQITWWMPRHDVYLNTYVVIRSVIGENQN